jgi:hypothetical protein
MFLHMYNPKPVPHEIPVTNLSNNLGKSNLSIPGPSSLIFIDIWSLLLVSNRICIAPVMVTLVALDKRLDKTRVIRVLSALINN